MDTISLLDGLVLTVVSMIVVFIILGSIWGLTELIAHIVGEEESEFSGTIDSTVEPKPVPKPESLVTNENNQKVVELMALTLASKDQLDKRFEIVETKRIK